MTNALLKNDLVLTLAHEQVAATLSGTLPRPVVQGFFDEPTNTATFVVHDPHSLAAAVIDSVLDFDPAAGTLSYEAADRVVAYVRAQGLTVAWILETHVHADHLSAAPYLQEQLGGQLAIGRGIIQVQDEFGKLFNAGTEFARTGAEFDRLFDDGDCFAIGGIAARVLHVPGHTSADLAYVIGDAAFVGDTLFMPDYGTARADFPGGDARQLFRSTRRLLSLPGDTRLFLCHDYKAPGRDEYVYETTVATQRAENVHVRDGMAEDDFVAMRTARDRTLKAPRLIMPSIQVNMRGGRLPQPEGNGTRYLKIPLKTVRL
ncbi:MBL fold metallo-hydrolase [Methylobacterium goesingense]|uniref:Glyoxylase-like metal-dependent hydrolase (Beta-lactamase superfamily II) n=1 Tax=Methylobacterium goesingense TaxID=243690 RepID=A0ABV2LB76_9HYPH|nr:MBL fold metallo-hydrolase [Methylobacterium goesingense]GJD76624.1 putative metallo-hydrolase [Methylobacterium goesingense]